MSYEFKVGWCPFCNQGWAEIEKDIRHDELIIVCSECDTVWKSPQDFKNNEPLRGYQHDDSFRTSKPTENEIQQKGWEPYILPKQKD